MAETIKSFVYKAHKEGISAEDTWRSAQSLFPHKCVSWGYIVRLRKLFVDGDRKENRNVFERKTSQHP